MAYDDYLKDKTAELEKSLEDENGLLPPKKKPVPPDENEYTIDLLLSQKRIKVRFKFDPGYETGKALTDFGFQWLIGQPIYEHDDTLEARKFLNKCLGADLELDCFEEKETTKLEVRETPQPEADSEFEKYQAQVRELGLHFKLDQADLCLKAIDTLYKITFAN
jgi:hypothetical protein